MDMIVYSPLDLSVLVEVDDHVREVSDPKRTAFVTNVLLGSAVPGLLLRELTQIDAPANCPRLVCCVTGISQVYNVS